MAVYQRACYPLRAGQPQEQRQAAQVEEMSKKHLTGMGYRMSHKRAKIGVQDPFIRLVTCVNTICSVDSGSKQRHYVASIMPKNPRLYTHKRSLPQ